MERNKGIIEDDGREISEMLGALSRVSAPADFDLHLKSRIARGRSASVRSGFWPAMKIAVPASLLGVLAVFLFLSGIFTSDLSEGVAVAETEIMVPQPAIEQPGDPVIASAAQPPVVEPSVLPEAQTPPPTSLPSGLQIAVERPPVRSERPRTLAVGDSRDTPMGGGSRDLALGSVNTIDVNARPDTTPRLSTPETMAPGFETNMTILVSEIFELLGIDAVYADGWNVRSLDSARSASRSGVRAGDRIIAADGRTLGAKATVPAGSVMKTLTVRRGDETVMITLRN